MLRVRVGVRVSVSGFWALGLRRVLSSGLWVWCLGVLDLAFELGFRDL